jgi:two-component system sensor histidine kinase KdpD
MARLEAESERARSSLLSAVSHDLRTPLSAIHGAAEALSLEGQTLSTEECHELAAMILDESGRLDHLVGNLLDITRLEHGHVKLTKEWQPLEEVVGAVITRLEAQRGHLPITVSLPQNLTLIPIDGVLIDQLLANLIENALAHAPGHPVLLRAEQGPSEVRVEVRDSGPGISDPLKERVFEKFYRPPCSRDGGTGLGLAICKAIIQAHGGRIWVEDAPDGGAVFCFTLPLEGTPPSYES